MRESLLERLICPLCRGNALSLTVSDRSEKEIREGELDCGHCHARMTIRKGIVHAMLGVDQTVLDEARGWVEMLDVPEKQHEFRDEWILALPFLGLEQSPDPATVTIWNQIGRNFFRNLDRIDVRGKWVLEIGAGRCWAVAELARRGAHTVGLDILTHKYLGLETADVWLAAEEIYFERVQGDMHNLPFRSGAFDYVITTASLHHTERLGAALKEIERVLQGQGRAFFMNEPMVVDGVARPDMSDSAELQYNIIESRPYYSEWMQEFRQAGLEVERIWFEDNMNVLLQKAQPGLKLERLLNRAASLVRYQQFIGKLLVNKLRASCQEGERHVRKVVQRLR